MPNYLQAYSGAGTGKRKALPRIGGYETPGFSNQNLKSLNYAGSAQGMPPPDSFKGELATDYPVTNYTGMMFNARTGLPFNGKNPWNGKTYKQGVAVDDAEGPLGSDGEPIDPANVAERYKPVDIIKSPEIAGATSKLLETFKKGAEDSLKGFDDFMGEFKTANTEALGKSRSATNIDPYIDTARDQQARYSDALDRSATDYAALNQDDRARQQDILTRTNALLPEYDRSANAIGDRQLQELTKRISRYKAGSGTPTSLGSDELRIAARGAADVLLPLEQAKIDRKFNILSNLELPMEQRYTDRETNRIANFNPQIAAQQFQTGQATESTIQGLKMQVAQMSFQDAERYMRSLGVPEQLKQQILSGQIGQLGQLAQLEDMSRYRGLNDVLGANLSQPVGYSMATGGLPSPSRYSPRGPGAIPGMPAGAPALASNTPIEVDPRTGWAPAPPWAQAANRYAYGGGRPVQDPNYFGGSQGNSRYDPSTGQIVNGPILVRDYRGPDSGYTGDVNLEGGGYA